MAIDFEDLPKDEQEVMFQQFLQQRKARKAKSAAKAKARKTILTTYQSEVEATIEKIASETELPQWTKEEEKEVIRKAREKKVKAQAKSKARTSVVKAHKPEYDQLFEEASKTDAGKTKGAK